MFMHVMYGVIGLMLVGLGAPLALGKVRPNALYGFRTQKTLSDPEIWYAANRVAGRDLMLTGGATLTASAVTWFVGPRNVHVLALTLLGVVLLALVATILHCGLALRRLSS
jgi:uncharacterized membrane protein